jgi:hypothetical protein
MATAKDEIEAIVLSEIRGLHHMSLYLRRMALSHPNNPQLSTMYAKAAAKTSGHMLQGVAAFQRISNNSTQIIRVEKVVVNGGQAIVGGIQHASDSANEINCTTSLPHHNPAYTFELAQQEFDEGGVDAIDEYADTEDQQ